SRNLELDSFHSVLWVKVSSPERSTRRRSSTAATFATSSRALLRRLEVQIKRWWICSREWRNENKQLRRRLHSPGCSHRNRGLFPYREPRSCLGSKKIWGLS